jgi:hypothetical protein
MRHIELQCYSCFEFQRMAQAGGSVLNVTFVAASKAYTTVSVNEANPSSRG